MEMATFFFSADSSVRGSEPCMGFGAVQPASSSLGNGWQTDLSSTQCLWSVLFSTWTSRRQSMHETPLGTPRPFLLSIPLHFPHVIVPPTLALAVAASGHKDTISSIPHWLPLRRYG
ncbi:uncharacterized protein PV07_07894 [Cladophialophora immunda]|uniref:Uncharacterized protein n=1 Tax=Cladophialophora immunda TaxID=569365 RepID=A0A0D2CX73_9EURO|nr:uncharacterized protein PV07_07894 [Cladophialophora immunda]KIW28214.1 hypothetical protein PV07_07894 [Cladophialophora immunda]